MAAPVVVVVTYHAEGTGSVLAGTGKAPGWYALVAGEAGTHGPYATEEQAQGAAQALRSQRTAWVPRRLVAAGIRRGNPNAWKRDPEARAEARAFRCD